MLAYLFALLTACANAAASVLQRAANRKRPADELFHPRLIARILREPLWFCGVLAMIASFLLLATALANGPLSVVQPLLVLELPLTLILADLTFGRPTRRNEWFGIGAISLGLAGLLLSLAPQEGGEFHVSAGTWAAGIGGSAAAMVVLIILAKRSRVGSMARPALLAVATGTGFGVNSAIIKAMTVTLERGGWVGLFTSWPVYGVLVCGLVSFFLLQTALGSGPLIAAQPGLTGSEPIVAMIWGVVVFDEHVRSGVYALFAALAAAVIGGGIYLLTRSFAQEVEPDGLVAAIEDDPAAAYTHEPGEQHGDGDPAWQDPAREVD